MRLGWARAILLNATFNRFAEVMQGCIEHGVEITHGCAEAGCVAVGRTVAALPSATEAAWNAAILSEAQSLLRYRD